MKILGIDIGGSGIKGAPVSLKKGVLAEERYRIATPQPATPDAVGDTVARIVDHFHWKGPVGCTFPAVVKEGMIYSAANVDKSWIGVDGNKLLGEKTGCPVLVINDADAAGLAEMKYGAGRGRKGVVFMLTFGTGIGSAVFVDGELMPNTELGHMQMNSRLRGGVESELYASDRARQDEELSWEEWAGRAGEFLAVLETLFSPDLFILGGGVSKKYKKFLPLPSTQVQIIPAHLRNEAGIVGAALAAKPLSKR